MSLRLGALHDALLHPGDAELARKAAEEVASYDNTVASLRLEVRIGSVLLGLNTTVLIGVLWMLFRLSENVARLTK